MGLRRYNLNYLKEISGGDEEFIMDMIQTFVFNTPDEIAIFRSLLEKKEWDLMGEHAHKFAPGLQFLGVISLRPVINQIEDFAFNKKKLELIPALIDKLDSECQLVSEELKNDFNL